MSDKQIAKEMIEGQAFVYGEYIVAFKGNRAILYEKVTKGVIEDYLSKVSDLPLDMFLSSCEPIFVDKITDLLGGKEVSGVNSEGQPINYKHIGQATTLRFI